MPRPLAHIQLFEDASRGPAGALLLMWDFTIRSKITFGFSIITLLSLAFDPVTQQMLKFPAKDAVITDGQAEMAFATIYTSNTFSEQLPNCKHNGFTEHRECPIYVHTTC